MRRHLRLVAGVLTATIAAVHAGSAPAATRGYVYVNAEGSVAAYAVDESGSLSVVPGSPFATVVSGSSCDVMTAAYDPIRGVLYASNPGANSISAFTVDVSTGALTPVPGSPFALSSGTGYKAPAGLAFDASHAYLYAGRGYGLGDAGLEGFAIDAGGALVKLPGSPFTAAGGSGFVVANDPVENTIITGTNGSDLTVLKVGPDGSLASIAGSPFTYRASSVHSLDVHPTRRELALGDAGTAVARGFQIAPGGGISAQKTFVSGPRFGVRFSPDGTRLYGVGDSLWAFDATPGPAFTSTSWGSVPLGGPYVNVGFDETGSLLFLTGSGALKSFVVGVGGYPSAAANVSFPAGGCAAGLAFVPSTPGIVVSPATRLVTTEAGGTAHVVVRLRTPPSADVTLSVASSDPSEGTVSPSTLTFTPEDWSTPQTITVTGVDDVLHDGDVAYTVQIGPASSADASYAGLDPGDLPAINLDDELPPGVSISARSLVTTEAGGTATFTVRLDALPTADVTVPVASSDPTEGSVSPASLVFTPDDWSTPQTVTVTGVDDAITDGDVRYLVVIGPAVSGDSGYDGLDAPDVSVTNRDDEPTPASGFVYVNAEGRVAGFRTDATGQLVPVPGSPYTTVPSSSGCDVMTALYEPMRHVLYVSNPGAASISAFHVDTGSGALSAVPGSPFPLSPNVAYGAPAGLALDAAGNSLYAGRGYGYGATDAGIEGYAIGVDGVLTRLSGSPFAAAGGSGFVVANDPVENTIITATNGSDLSVLRVGAGGVLTPIPGSPFLNLVSNAHGLDVHPTRRELAVGDAQVGRVRGFSLVAGGGLSAEVSSGNGPVYGVRFTPDGNRLFGVSDGALYGFDVAAGPLFTAAPWTSIPTGFISKNLVFHPGGSVVYVTGSGALRSFLLGQGGAPTLAATQTFTVGGCGAGIAYAVATAAILVTPTSGLVTTEAGGTATFAVRLATVPTADVTIALSSSNPAEGVVAPTALTFTPADWSTEKIVTVTGVADDVADGDVAYSIVTAPAVSADPDYDGRDPADVSVTNRQLPPGITVDPTYGLTTSEAGATAHFTVRLDSRPQANVTIALNSSDPTEGTVAPASMTFTKDDWATPQTATVTGVDDGAVDGPVLYKIVTAPAVSDDPGYDGQDAADVTVTNLDDEESPVTGHVYVNAEGSVAAFAVNASGHLTPVAGSPFATVSSYSSCDVMTLAYEPSRRVLYASNPGASSISAFAVNTASGKLSTVPGSPFALSPGSGTSRPAGLAIDASHDFLYAGKGWGVGDAGIDGFAIGANGALTRLQASPFLAGGDSGFVVATDPVENTIITGTNGSNLSVLRVGAGGALAPVNGSPFLQRTSNVHGLDVHPTRRELAAGDGGTGVARGFQILPGGGLSLQKTQVSGPEYGVRFTPDGSRLYAAGVSRLYGFAASSGPLFTPLPWGSVAAVTAPKNIVFNASATLILVTGGGSLSSYTIGAAGLPTLVETRTFPVGGCAAGIAFVPDAYPRGDTNGDGVVSVLDVMYLLNSLFAGGPAPLGSADANDDGQVNVADVFYLINYLFAGGPSPAL